jgi:hypothetical protein
MDAPPTIWILRLTCIAAAFTTADALAAATADWSSGARIQLAVLGWTLWASAVLASWYRRPVAIAALRTIAPVTLIWATALLLGEAGSQRGGSEWTRVVAGLAALWIITVVAFLPQVGQWFVNGVSYGDELRMILRPPLAVVIVLAALAGAAAALMILGSVVLRDGAQALGVGAWVLALGLVAAVSIAGTRLMGRVAIFVPAGVTLIDEANLVDPVLLSKSRIAAMLVLDARTFPADPVGDLGGAALGPSIAADLLAPVDLTVRSRDSKSAESTSASMVRFVPTRAAAFAAVAAARGITVRRSHLP